MIEEKIAPSTEKLFREIYNRGEFHVGMLERKYKWRATAGTIMKVDYIRAMVLCNIGEHVDPNPRNKS